MAKPRQRRPALSSRRAITGRTWAMLDARLHRRLTTCAWDMARAGPPARRQRAGQDAEPRRWRRPRGVAQSTQSPQEGPSAAPLRWPRRPGTRPSRWASAGHCSRCAWCAGQAAVSDQPARRRAVTSVEGAAPSALGAEVAERYRTLLMSAFQATASLEDQRDLHEPEHKPSTSTKAAEKPNNRDPDGRRYREAARRPRAGRHRPIDDASTIQRRSPATPARQARYGLQGRASICWRRCSIATTGQRTPSPSSQSSAAISGVASGDLESTAVTAGGGEGRAGASAHRGQADAKEEPARRAAILGRRRPTPWRRPARIPPGKPGVAARRQGGSGVAAGAQINATEPPGRRSWAAAYERRGSERSSPSQAPRDMNHVAAFTPCRP